jgi:hypothetical protein
MFVGALFLTAVLGQATAQAPSAQVRGVVVEEETGKPVGNARVTLIESVRRVPSDGQHQAMTDRDGRFAFARLDGGAYLLQVAKGGFAPAPRNAVVARITIKPGEVLDDIRLSLLRGGAIAGRVVDGTGEVIVEGRVTPLRATVTGSSPTLMPAGPSTQTNDLGEYRLYGLAAGEYYVQVIPRFEIGFVNSVPQTSALAPTYFPDQSDVRKARPITVRAGQTTANTDVRVVTARVFRISGIVVGETGKPVANAMVTVMPSSQPTVTGSAPRTRSGPDGRFSIVNVAAGSYMITAAIPEIIGPAPGGSRASGSLSGGVVGAGGVGGGGVSQETINGVTTRYRPGGSPTPLTVGDSDVSGLRLVARAPK